MGLVCGDHRDAAGFDAGGIGSLVALLQEEGYGEAIEADFQETYGLPLAPGILYTWRRFRVLVRGLQEGSRFVRLAAKNTPKGDVDTSEWGRTDQLLAIVADLLVVSNWQRTGSKEEPSFLFLRDKDAPVKVAVPDEDVRERLRRMRNGEVDG